MARTAWNKGISTRALGKSRPITKKIEYVCEACSVSFYDYPSTNRKTCSVSCMMVSSPSKRSGKKHYRWKGGTTSPDRDERIRFRNTMQKEIFQRDNYTCQICLQYGGLLQVDHVKPWSDYPELRFNEDNCRTLCMACHYYITFKRNIPDGIVWGHNLNRRIRK